MRWLFEPRSIAVIGASNTPGKVGYTVFKNLKQNKSLKIYPVNIKHSLVQGVKAYKSIVDITTPIDVAIIAVPAAAAIKVINECAQAKVRYCVILTAGFKELHIKGKNASEYIVEELNKYPHPPKILGPNCLGFINTRKQINATFLPFTPPAGNISLVMQSGAYATFLLDFFEKYSTGIDIYASLGDKWQINENHVLEYLANRSTTSTIGLYLENISNGAKLKKILKSITPHKHVVALLTGKTQKAAGAQIGHTGEMIKDFTQLKAMLESAGVAVVHTIEEFAHALYLAQFLKQKQILNKSVVITNAGGPSVAVVDALTLSNITPIEIGKNSNVKDTLKKEIPKARAHQVIDLQGDARPEDYYKAIRVLINQKAIDKNTLVSALYTPQGPTSPKDLIATLNNLKNKYPNYYYTAFLLGGKRIDNSIKSITNSKVPYVRWPQIAIWALEKLNRAEEVRRGRGEGEGPVRNRKYAIAGELTVDKWLKLIHSLGITTPNQIVITLPMLKNTQQVHTLIQQFLQNHPKIVIKPFIPNSAHFTQAGLLKTNVTSADTAVQILKNMLIKITQLSVQNKLGVKPTELYKKVAFIIQEQIENKAEVFVGIKHSKYLNTNTLTIGWGGIYANYLQDLYTIDLPTTPNHIKWAFNQTKIANYVQSKLPTTLDKLIKEVYKVSSMPYVVGDFKSADINPIILNSKGAYVVDLKIFTYSNNDQAK